MLLVLDLRKSSNVLFTLKPENARQAGAILGQLLQISRSGSSAGVIHESDDQVSVNLGDWEKQALGMSNAAAPENTESDMNPQPAVNPETPANNGGL